MTLKSKLLTYASILLLFFSLGNFLSIERSFKLNDSLSTPISGNVYTVLINKFTQSKSGWNRVEGEFLNSNLKHQKLLLLAENRSFTPKSIIRIQANVEVIKNKGNPGEFDMEHYYAGKGIYYSAFLSKQDGIRVIKTAEIGILQRIEKLQTKWGNTFDAFLKEDESSLAKALILGDKKDIETNIKSDFSRSGAMHLLAVSGLHVGIIYMILLFVTKLFSKFITRRLAVTIVIVLLWFYALLSGFTPSVIRATFLFTVLSFSTIFSKNNNALNSLFFSAFVLLLIQPAYLFDIGFQLSYLAMIGIILFNRNVTALVRSRFKLIDFLWKGTAIGISAQITTAPLSLYYFHQFPNYFILTNLVLIIGAGLLLSLGILSLIVSPISIVNVFVFSVFGISLTGLLFFVGFIGELPYAVATGFNFSLNDVLLFYFFIFGLFLIYQWKQKYVLIVLPLFLPFIAYIQYDRFQKMKERHICIFNSNQQVVLLKDGENAICFYKSDKLKKAERLVEDYSKVYPVENCNYQPWSALKNYHVKTANEKFQFQNLKGEITILTNQNKTIIYNYFNSKETGNKLNNSKYNLLDLNGKSSFNKDDKAILIRW